MNAYYFYRLSHYLYLKKVPVIPKIIQLFIFLIYNSSIPFQARIGKGTVFAYGGIGVIIHKKAIIGRNVVIGSSVVIGGKKGQFILPKIGDNVYLATGSKILGEVKIGNNAIIGANAVVLIDVPDNSTAVGVPAKILRK
ncbi:serine acetyltransferase [Bizionia saleffrena]|uniref:Serine acetyltransferase n=1 Tax=Bizionia saleffrena TaxID=291189 RepID=A0A8H2LH38_9FLAO|nr:serine acetyltransferase [Bizionia saleffrena]